MVIDDLLFGLIAVGACVGVLQFFYVWLTWRSDEADRAESLLAVQALYKLTVERPLQLIRQVRAKPRR